MHNLWEKCGKLLKLLLGGSDLGLLQWLFPSSGNTTQGTQSCPWLSPSA